MSKPGNFGAGDTLTPAQRERLVGAVGVLLAKREAYRAGASEAQVQAHIWRVEVDALDSRVA